MLSLSPDHWQVILPHCLSSVPRLRLVCRDVRKRVERMWQKYKKTAFLTEKEIMLYFEQILFSKLSKPRSKTMMRYGGTLRGVTLIGVVPAKLGDHESSEDLTFTQGREQKGVYWVPLNMVDKGVVGTKRQAVEGYVAHWKKEWEANRLELDLRHTVDALMKIRGLSIREATLVALCQIQRNIRVYIARPIPPIRKEIEEMLCHCGRRGGNVTRVNDPAIHAQSLNDFLLGKDFARHHNGALSYVKEKISGVFRCHHEYGGPYGDEKLQLRHDFLRMLDALAKAK